MLGVGEHSSGRANIVVMMVMMMMMVMVMMMIMIVVVMCKTVKLMINYLKEGILPIHHPGQPLFLPLIVHSCCLSF